MDARSRGRELALRSPHEGVSLRHRGGMGVGWNFGLEKRYSLRTAGFTQVVQGKAGTLTRVHGSATLQVGKSKVGFPIPPVGGPQEREQRCVLAEREELPIAPGPTPGSKVKGKNPDFRDKRVGHNSLGW